MTLTQRVANIDEITNPWVVIGDEITGKSKVVIYRGLKTTVDNAAITLQDGDVLVRYHELTGDNRSAVNFYLAKLVVLGDVQLAWYEHVGIPIPLKVQHAQEARMAKAKTAKPEAEGGETAAKAPRVTTRSIIEQGLLAGKAPEDILKEVKQHKPDGKADLTHVAYYRHFLVKDGKMEAPPRQPRAKKTAEAKVEAPPSAQTTRAAGKKGTAAAGGAGKKGK